MKVLDNINSLWGDDLKAEIVAGSKLQIAASCFSIYAYEALKEELEKVESLEFVFTSPAFVPKDVTDKISQERREFHIPNPNQAREKDLYGTEFEIQLKNKLTQRAIAKECADWIRRKALFRSNATNQPMQQFACLEEGQDAIAYTPLHGFTAVDIGYQKGDAVSNFINKVDEMSMAQSYLQLFEQVWTDEEKLQDVTGSICSHIESVYQENSPEKIYFLMLYNIFTEFLEDINEDLIPNELTGYKESVIWNKLYNFQRDAATGIINKLEKYNGCILADSVGLGKTFTALAVVKYYEQRNKDVLVLCPKKLEDNWQTYKNNYKTNTLKDDRLRYHLLFHTDLSRASGFSSGIDLSKINWANYDLVVIDESHNFRNNDTFKDKETRYQKLMNTVIREGVNTKVLMLSATPVNNRFSDLRNQLALAYEGKSENLSSKLKTGRSIEEIFRRAQSAFNEWSKLPSSERTAKTILGKLDFDFFELLDSVTIARSRKHIETFYDMEEIGRFPSREKPLTFRRPLTPRDDVMSFNDIYCELSSLKLSIYAPLNYVLPSRMKIYEDRYDTVVAGGNRFRQADREKSLQSLMTTNLLKRLESSVDAFRISLNNLKENHDGILGHIDSFNRSGTEFKVDEIPNSMSELGAEDDDLAGLDAATIGKKVKISLADMDLTSWERELKSDLTVINGLLAEMHKVKPEDDDKLQHLKALIHEKIDNPINPGNKKVIIFTAFADTAKYLYETLSGDLLDIDIHTGRVTGQGDPKTTLNRRCDFQTLLTLFSPISKDKALLFPDDTDEIDVLIGTDCISEGQNLQDCDYLINYDIHWNPVRIIQRFGRIDRIGSQNETIQLVNYWPDISLDEYINLKERVENRMVIADVSATGDDNVLSAKANDVSYRKEQLRRLQDEVIEMEDLKTGVSIVDLGLNEFHMDLLNYLKIDNHLPHLPNGLHAIIPPNPDLGLVPGVIFTLRNRNSGVNINQHNRLHPYYLIYVTNGGDIIIDHSHVKTLLDIARTSCKSHAEPIRPLCRIFNDATADGRKMDFYSNLLDQAIASIISVKQEKDVDNLFSDTYTSIFTDRIEGLDDFELISFLVVQGDEV